MLVALVTALFAGLLLLLLMSAAVVANETSAGSAERAATAGSSQEDRTAVQDEVLGIVEFQPPTPESTVASQGASSALERSDGQLGGVRLPVPTRTSIPTATAHPTPTPEATATAAPTATPTEPPTLTAIPTPSAVPSLTPTVAVAASPQPEAWPRPAVSLESIELAEALQPETERQPDQARAEPLEADQLDGDELDGDESVPSSTPGPESAPTGGASAAPATAAVVGAPTGLRGERLYLSLNYDIAALGYTISFHDANLRFLGVTLTEHRHIEIYDRITLSDADLAHVIAHELGHAIDHVLNDVDDRNRWRAARGMDPGIHWWPPNAGVDRATPAGDFAECFASVIAGGRSDSAWGSCSEDVDLLVELASS